jgi:hypothetical protein
VEVADVQSEDEPRLGVTRRRSARPSSRAVVRDGSDADALRAIESMLARVYGKSKETVEVSAVKEPETLEALRAMSREECKALLRQLEEQGRLGVLPAASPLDTSSGSRACCPLHPRLTRSLDPAWIQGCRPDRLLRRQGAGTVPRHTTPLQWKTPTTPSVAGAHWERQ